MPDIRTAQSAYMMGRARFRKWVGKFMADWYAPEIELQMVAMWDSMPPEVKAQLEAKNPVTYAAMDAKIAQIKGTVK